MGAVLVGGASSRMGADKASVEIAGATMLDRVAGAVAAAAGRVVVLGTGHQGYECWPDLVEAWGPLAGIATVLARTTDDRVLVVAVDHPFVRVDTLVRLIAVDSALAVVPVDEEGVRQVTCSVYPRSIADLAREEAEAEGSIQSLLDRVSFEPVTPETWRSWGEDGRSWYSVDTPEALAAGLDAYPLP